MSWPNATDDWKHNPLPMLTCAIYKNLNAVWLERWLKRTLPAKHVNVDLDTDDNLRFFFEGERDPTIWDSGRCVKLLKKEAPDVTTALLFRLCCLYDEQQETSEVLGHATAKRLGCRGGPAFFYWTDHYGGGVLTTMTLKGRRKSVEEIRVRQRKTDEDAFSVLLLPSEWLCDVLLQHLVTRL